MSVFVIVGAVALLMLVYMISVLGVLPWFIYIPFVLLFGVVFFWDRIRTMLPWDIKRPRRSGTSNSFTIPCSGRGKGGGGRGRRSGKRM
jgi:hypothetical protein